MSIKAQIIKDSINSQTDDRLTTFLLTFPRIVLSEFNTHRMLSKNSASSRAIPYKKMVEMVKTNPFIPINFQEDHKGMQGKRNIKGLKLKLVKFVWLRARDCAVFTSFVLHKFNVTKQLCNRILEPFMWHTVLATGTEWENFFALRAHPDAEIHIAKLAELMLEEYNKSIPEIKTPSSIFGYIGNDVESKVAIQGSEWHIPFSDKMPEGLSKFDQLKVSIARCARLSYVTFDGDINVEKDFEIYDKLSSGVLHASPFEHVAFPISESKFVGNYKGWYQFRKLLPNESAKDNRVIKRRVVNGVVE